MIPECLEQLKPTVLPEVTTTIIDLANGILGKYTLQDLLDLIAGGGAKRFVYHR
jgi:hypothetical protein